MKPTMILIWWLSMITMMLTVWRWEQTVGVDVYGYFFIRESYDEMNMIHDHIRGNDPKIVEELEKYCTDFQVMMKATLLRGKKCRNLSLLETIAKKFLWVDFIVMRREFFYERCKVYWFFHDAVRFLSENVW